MKATLPIKSIDGKVAQNRNENHFVKQYTAINKDLEEVVILRIYATDAQHYACVWLQHKKAIYTAMVVAKLAGMAIIVQVKLPRML